LGHSTLQLAAERSTRRNPGATSQRALSARLPWGCDRRYQLGSPIGNGAARDATKTCRAEFSGTALAVDGFKSGARNHECYTVPDTF
jgi:hypothetical protein